MSAVCDIFNITLLNAFSTNNTCAKWQLLICFHLILFPRFFKCKIFLIFTFFYSCGHPADMYAFGKRNRLCS